jgi:putative ABC transport system permease protein
LSVQASSERAMIADALPRQGLERLSQIAWLLVIAATSAVALALCASMFQRRDEFASLRLQSFTPRQIQKILGWEAILVTGSGALLGALAGMYGHLAADRYLHDTTGYPVVWSLGLTTVILTLLAVSFVTILILIVPGRTAARSPLRLALEGR